MSRLWILLLVVAPLACTPRATPNGGGNGSYGLGRAATPQEIAAIDVDVGPDGAGLPAGNGSAADGAVLYAAKCASCHGDRGQGIPPAYPALMGRDPAGESFDFANNPKVVKTIGNYWPSATSLFDYVRRAMPFATPGTLTNDEVYAIVAHLLAENRIIESAATLDSAALMQVRMPAAGHFVPDDRRGGTTVR
jgi:cytochrome c